MMMLASQMEKIKLSQIGQNKLMENHLQLSKNLNKKRMVNFHQLYNFAKVIKSYIRLKRIIFFLGNSLKKKKKRYLGRIQGKLMNKQKF
jgi:hypothetical protein